MFELLTVVVLGRTYSHNFKDFNSFEYILYRYLQILDVVFTTKCNPCTKKKKSKVSIFYDIRKNYLNNSKNATEKVQNNNIILYYKICKCSGNK